MDGCVPLALAAAIMPGTERGTDDDDVGSIFFCCFLNAIPASKWKKWKVEMVNQHTSYSATAAMIR